MCLGRLDFCWFSGQNQVSEVRPAAFVEADTRKSRSVKLPLLSQDPLQLCHGTMP